MKVGIMQPYFFPYLGYFSLINYVDRFIFFDTPQYISHGWVNRNRILKQDGAVTYIIVPIQKAKRETAIKDILIANNLNWKKRIYGQLSAYKKRAPRYKDTLELVHNILDKNVYFNLSILNVESVVEICKYLGISCEFDIFSQMDLDISNVSRSDEWALHITKAINGDIYVNPPNGKKFFDMNNYRINKIELEFLESNLPQYIQRIGHFERGMSIIDVLMFCDVSEIREMINDYKIIK